MAGTSPAMTNFDFCAGGGTLQLYAAPAAQILHCRAGRLKRQSGAPADNSDVEITTDHTVLRESMAEPFPDVPLLDVRGLETHFLTDRGVVRAVDGVSLHINAGETLGVVGESGSGKSVTALSIMRLIREPPGRIASGEVRYKGLNLLDVSSEQMRKIRGKEIAMIFQEPMTSLNPVFTVGEQIAESIRLHEGLSRRDAADKSIEMLRIVHISNPERRVKEYPHLLSGGMRQRVMIAMALSCNPKLLIADEPTTALDVTIQAQILDLLNELKAKFKMAVMLITHDMGVIAETAQRVVVMYGAQVVEEAPVMELFGNPQHPYTQGLLRSIPRIDLAATERRRLEQIPGTVPTLRGDIKPGCRFAPRCQFAQPLHFERTPPLHEVQPGHKVACFLR
jgi:peptide/nickel transport system ATP-binding protein